MSTFYFLLQNVQENLNVGSESNYKDGTDGRKKTMKNCLWRFKKRF